MASVNPMKNRPGWWQIRISTGKDPDTGKYRRLNLHVKAETEAEAKAEAVLLEAQHKRSKFTADLVLFRHLTEQWWDANPNNNEKATRRGYRNKIDNWVTPYLGAIPLVELNAGHVEDWQLFLTQTKGLAPSTANQCYSIVRQASHYGLRRRMLTTDPTAGVKRSKVKQERPEEPDRADVNKMEALLQDHSAEHYNLFVVTQYFGGRRGEVLALRWGDLDTADRVINVRHAVDIDRTLKDTKTHRQRQFPVTDRLARVFNDQAELQTARLSDAYGHPVTLDPAWLVFPSPEDPTLPRNPDAVSRYFKNFRTRHGLDRVWMTGLRHMVISDMVAAGIDLPTIAEMMGNSPQTVLRNYAKSQKAQQIRAAEAVGQLPTAT